MSQDFITVHYNTGNGYKQERQLPVAEFIAWYTDYTKKLTDIAYHFDISVFNVRHAAELLGLPSKAHYCLFRRNGYTLDLERVRQLIEVDRLDVQSAADALGVSYYLVKKTIRDNKLNVKNGHKRSRTIKCRACIPPPGATYAPCEWLPVCQQLEPGGLPLKCEELLGDELGIELYDRDSTPSPIMGGGVPYCNLMR